MQSIKIEKGIPVPPPSLGSEMRKLEIGDSFVIEEKRSGHVSTVASRLQIKVKSVKVSKTQRRYWRVE